LLTSSPGPRTLGPNWRQHDNIWHKSCLDNDKQSKQFSRSRSSSASSFFFLFFLLLLLSAPIRPRWPAEWRPEVGRKTYCLSSFCARSNWRAPIRRPRFIRARQRLVFARFQLAPSSPLARFLPSFCSLLARRRLTTTRPPPSGAPQSRSSRMTMKIGPCPRDRTKAVLSGAESGEKSTGACSFLHRVRAPKRTTFFLHSLRAFLAVYLNFCA